MSIYDVEKTRIYLKANNYRVVSRDFFLSFQNIILCSG
jgi:hypothetical protein